MYLQPADWIEQDVQFKYVVDVFGRTDKGEVAQVRLTGFQPYFYLKSADGETAGQIESALTMSSGKTLRGLKITQQMKLDAMRGFSGLQPTKVWKLTVPALWMFKTVAKTLKNGMKIGNRRVRTEDIYESNLPPFIRLFHEMDLSPASPFEFEADDYEPDEGIGADVFYEVNYKELIPSPSQQIPLLVAAYDIETYSESGNFPMSSNPEDEVIQIGVSFRYTNDMLTNVKRYVFVSGTVDASKDPSVTFVACRNEKDLLDKFQLCIQNENPDIIAGYNTFGFDDGYIADRAERHKLSMKLGRTEGSFWKQDYAKTEKKTFELASGKFAVRYLEVPGRLSVDLMLSVRREQNLDSYKLDNVANTFLRDKVTNIVILSGTKTQMYEIHTKSTRGLFVGNLVRFDVVTNTNNPYREGAKFYVKEVYPKKFIVELPYANYLFDDLEDENRGKLEWSFAKDDVTAKEMFASHRGSAADRAVIAKYCIQDCDLVLTLMAKLDTLVNARGMADVCRVPIGYIFLRGQGIKIYSAVVYNASKRNQIIMTQESLEGDESYEGAIVLPPKIGMYLDQPIPVLDFNSLYPSNMIAFNLSPDTLVYIKKYDSRGKKVSQEGPDGDEFKKQGYVIDEIGYDIYDEAKNPTGRVVCGFVQPKSEDPRTIGVLPLTLDILLKKRKETRKIMESVEDDAQKAVLNGLQLAYKVVANSVYGQCGANTSPIRKKEVAACTTALGRARIYDAKKVVETEFGATVIYGDSVTSYTPILIRHLGIVRIMSIEELGNMGLWMPCEDGEKEYSHIENVESWTDNGWTPLQRVIRHKLASHKKIIRVLTHTGLVDVTDDHSLLRCDKTEVSPKYVKIGDELLHNEFPNVESNFDSTIEKAMIAGFFFGDGSCGTYECPSGKKTSWALNNANIDLLQKYVDLCDIAYPEFKWGVNPTLESSGVFKLVPRGGGYGSIVKFVECYRVMMYAGKRKNIPDWVINGTHEVRQAFWDGLYDADGDKDMNGYIRIDQKHQTTCAQIALLGHLLGYKVSVNTRSDKPDICRLTFTKGYQRVNPIAVKKLYEIQYAGYVYDLTTDNHHFQAGVGKMIVHNTDSIFVQFPTKDLAESIELGKRAAEKITSLCRKPYKIEYEKTFYPFILFCRKRYVGLKYEGDTTHCKRATMGVALKRRDNAPIVKDVFGGALDILLEKRDIKTAQKFVQDMLVKLMKNEFPLEKFIVTKQLRDDYKNPDQIAHRVLADRMEARDPGNAPQVGDRLAYVYVSSRRDEKKQGDKIEHVDYVRDKRLKPDTDFYITNQLQNPVAQLFALAIEHLEGYRPKVDYESLYRDFLEKFNGDEEEATLAVLKRKEKDLDSILFLSAPYLTKHKRGPMDAFLGRK